MFYQSPDFYITSRQVSLARQTSARLHGICEIADVNLEYLHRNQLSVHRLSRGFAWQDAGTSTALQEASAYIEAIERRQGVKIGCPEEAAVVQVMPNCEYRDYLKFVANEFT